MPVKKLTNPIVVRGTEILATDTRQVYREKIARITLDSMVQFVGLLDAQGTVLEINKVALDAVGITLADVEGRPFWTTFWWQVSDEINATLRESIVRAAKGEFVRWDTPIYGRSGGTETIIIDASLCPVIDDQGEVVFIAAEGRDITEKKAQEQEIAQKNLELQGLLQRIRELDEIKTQFFANVSHELRTPLALILGPAQRLINDNSAIDRDQLRETGEVIARNAQMLLKHVNDLLDMSKIEARKLKIEAVDTDVAALLRLLASHFSVLAAERDIDFVVDAGDETVAAVDQDKLQRVMMNLLGNAFKFVPFGGRIRTSVKLMPNDLVISIDDSGPGVKFEHRQAIFERFRQGDGGVDRKTSGTGLGLAIAKEFVEMHKGTIEVFDSELGGACFLVTIPLNSLEPLDERRLPGASVDQTMLAGVIEELRFASPNRRAETSEAGSKVSVATRARPRVLVVEDNPDMNRFIRQSLESDYDVVSAFDGREGLKMAAELRPLIVISDIMMPNMSGVEMIAELRNRPEFESIAVLVLSAKADENLMVKLLDEGARDYIVKPFSEEDLKVRVRNLITGLQVREEMAQSLVREHTLRIEVEHQRQLLESVFTQAPLLVAVLRGPDHVVELVNPRMCEQVWQRPESEMLNRPLFETVPELRHQVIHLLLEDVYRTGVPHVGTETPVEFDRGNGIVETVYFDFIYSAFFNISGQIEGVFLVASDVTAQVVAREQVDGLRKSAESANRAKDEFMAMLGHELRNPLSPIVTALHLLKISSPEDSEQARTVIERQVNHLIRLVDDLLDVSRIARGKVVLKKEIIEIAEIVAKGIEMMSPIFEERHHLLTVDVPATGLLVDGDPGRLGQILSNLLSNAAKYTPPRGRIVVTARRIDNDVVVSVLDNGIGIAGDSLPFVFDLFVQERQALDRSAGGLGLGLTIVRNLVESHGGTVSARSEGSGMGSEFIVRLPSATVDPTQLRTEKILSDSASPKQNMAGNGKVLVVDDNRDAAQALALTLAFEGYETKMANDGPSAIQAAEEFKPDIAIVDIGLPVMDGYELASRLRDIPGLENIRLLALTGYGQESDRRKSIEAGFHKHLVKPVEIAVLTEAMNS